MAKQSKKIKNHIAPKEPAKPPKKPVGKDYFLIAVIVVTIFISIYGWAAYDGYTRMMYIALAVALILTYTQRHANFSEDRMGLIAIASFVFMVIAVIFFALSAYAQFSG